MQALPEQVLRPYAVLGVALEACCEVPESRKACAGGDLAAALPASAARILGKDDISRWPAMAYAGWFIGSC